MTEPRASGRPLRKYRYVAMKQTFEQRPDNTVLVTCDDGRKGLFHPDGRYIEGDLTHANIHMLVWTAAPPQIEECRYRWGEVPVDITRPSGWPEPLERILHYHLGRPLPRDERLG